MPNNETLGASFSIDTTNLKAGLAQANRLIRESESEFKAAAAGMDNWQQSQTGLEAKIKSLNDVTAIQQEKVNGLTAEYDRLIADGLDPASAQAVKLRTQINNEQAALERNKTELRNTTEALDNFSDASNDANDASDDASGGFTVMKGALAELAAEGIKAAVAGLKELVTASDEANASFQAMTGATTEEMSKFKDVMADLYADNYGESMDDIAQALASVKQSSKEVDPSKLKDLAKNAIILRDTFGFEYAESMRAVNMLMDQFGVSGEEAYNLIVQGAQKGLNKNDDLLDTINEYGVHYSQMGLTADDFFNSLANGAADGTFSVDKLGDAYKEFGIRVKDTANSTTEGFELLGLNADEMRAAFAKGGDSAKQATDKTVKALFAMKDEVKQNQAGVNLFGTMWEDLGKDAIQALTNTNGEIAKTSDAMKTLDKVKYSSVTSQVNALGREIKGSISEELEKNALPAIKNFLEEFKNSGAIDTVTTAIGFCVENIQALTIGVGLAVAAWKTMQIVTTVTTAIQGTTGAMAALNAVMAANPVGLVVTAVAALGVALVGIASTMDDTKESQDLLTTAQRETVTAAQEAAQAYAEEKEAADEMAESNIANVDYVANNLLPQLQNLIDANGKVKKGYEDRANFILGQLNEALGTEYNDLSQIIDANGQVKQSIYDVINAKKAQILLEAYEKSYKKAVEEVAAAEKARATQAQELAAQRKVYEDAQKAADEARIQLDEKLANAKTEADYRKLASEANYVDGLDQEATRQKGVLDKKQTEYNKSDSNLRKYYKDIADYETASTLVTSGETTKAIGYLNNLSSGFKTAADVTGKSVDKATGKIEGATKKQKKELEQQVIDTEVNARLMKENYNNGVEGVTEEMVETAEEQAETAKEEFHKVGGNITKGIANGAEKEEWTLTGAMSSLISSAVNAAKKAAGIKSPSRLFKNEIGKYLGLGVGAGIDDSTKSVVNSVKRQVSDIQKAYNVGTLNSNIKASVNSQPASQATPSGAVVVNQTNNYSQAHSRYELYQSKQQTAAAVRAAMGV